MSPDKQSALENLDVDLGELELEVDVYHLATVVEKVAARLAAEGNKPKQLQNPDYLQFVVRNLIQAVANDTERDLKDNGGAILVHPLNIKRDRQKRLK